MEGPAPTRGGSIAVRRGHPDDVDVLVDVHAGAFPDARGVEVRRRLFLHNRLGGVEHLRVAEEAGAIVGHAFAFPVGLWFGGKVVHGLAIASVGVAVDARARGVARALMAAIHEEARGDSLFTLLYPFRQAFYARLGYAPTARNRVLGVSPLAIPSAWGDEPGSVRRARGDDAAAIAAVYVAAAARGTGFLERTPLTWERDLCEERIHWLVHERGGTLVGYASFRLAQTEPHARVRAAVNEVVTIDDGSRRRLFGALRALADQVSELTFAVADDDPFDWGFLDGDRERGGTAEVEHAQGVVNTGPMIRLVDAAGALAARGYAEDGSLALSVDGGAPLRLDVRGGSVRVSAANADDAFSMSAGALASVAFGGLWLEDAVRLGWVAVPTGADVHRASALLRLPPFFSLDAF